MRSALQARSGTAAPPARSSPYGPLIPDPRGLLDLPNGFSYAILGRRAAPMADGLLMPGRHDGMAAFPGSKGNIVLVRNHEIDTDTRWGAYGRSNELIGLVPPHLFYDLGFGRAPALGCVTISVYDPVARQPVREFLALAGTMENCSGGPTPWGTWLSCEENVDVPGADREQRHGYVFEVPASETPTIVPPRPLRAMGRFYHESAAVDPRSGIVYMTEDRVDGALYRFAPDVPGDLAAGGRLQALAIAGQPALDTSNHGAAQFPVGTRFRVRWVDLPEVDRATDDLRHLAQAQGAALFRRGEGATWAGRDVYFVCTDGGQARVGQVWRLTPPPEPTGGLAARSLAGELELFAEPNDPSVLDRADSITVAPDGTVYVCEDGLISNYVVGITPDGCTFQLARNAWNPNDLAGAVFSPDGSTLFVNLLEPGRTYAITGPW